MVTRGLVEDGRTVYLKARRGRKPFRDELSHPLARAWGMGMVMMEACWVVIYPCMKPSAGGQCDRMPDPYKRGMLEQVAAGNGGLEIVFFFGPWRVR